MSFMQDLQQKWTIRNAFVLTLFIVCESIQLFMGVSWFLHQQPYKNDWAARIFPEGFLHVSPEREILLFRLFLLILILVTSIAVLVFYKKLDSREFWTKYRFLFIVEGMLTVFLLICGFKIMAYAFRPKLAQEAFVILLWIAVVHKIFWRKIRSLWQELSRLVNDPKNGQALEYLVFGVSIATIFLIIYVPHPVAAVGRMFFGEQLHHFDLGLMASGWAFQSGCRLNVDAFSQYGVGMPIVMSQLAKLTGGFNYVHVLETLVSMVILYYVLYFLLLRAWLGKWLIVIFGILTVIRLQMFHAGVMPFVMTYPMATPFRFFYDVVFFWMMFLYLKGRRKVFLILAAVCCSLAFFHMIDTGLYLSATFYSYLIVCLLIPHYRSELIKTRRDIGWLVFYVLLVPCLSLVWFWLVQGPEIFKSAFWMRTFEFAYYFINGMGLQPIAGNFRNGFYFSTVIGLMIPGIYLLTILFVVGLCYFQRMKHENLLAVLWSVYGLSTYQYYVVHSVESSYYVYVVSFVSVVCFWYKHWAQVVSPAIYRRIGFVLIGVAIFALATNHNFISYPNLLNHSRDPIVDPRVHQIPPGRAYYFNHLFREFPDNFKMARNSLGEFDEKLVSETDFSSDDQMAEYFKNEFDFSDDVRLIQKYIPLGKKAPLMSSFDVAILMAANRAPYFKYIPILNSRPLRMRIFPVSSIPSQEHLNITLKQLEESPEYIFMERIFLDRANVPAAYYHDSPELMTIVNHICDRYQPVETGKYLVAMKFKGEKPSK